MRDQNPASLPPSIDASPEPAASTFPSLNGPQAANLGDGANGRHDIYCEGGRCRCFSDVDSEDVGTLPDVVSDGAIGRLSESEERFENYLRWHFNVVAEEGKGSAYIGLGIENAKLHLAAIVREHTERAWDEGKRATWSALGAPFVWAAPENPYRNNEEQS